MPKIPPHGEHEPWTQEEITNLHEMVRDYAGAKWMKGKLRKWGLLAMWILGLPTAVHTFWEPIVRCLKWLGKAFG